MSREGKELLVYFDRSFPFFIADSMGIEKNSSQLHCHNAVEVDFIKEGTGTYLINGKAYPFSAGDFFVINKQDIHMAYNDVNVVMQVMMFDEVILYPNHEYTLGQNALKAYSYFGGERTNQPQLTLDIRDELTGYLQDMEREYTKKPFCYQQAILSALLKFAVVLSRTIDMKDWFEVKVSKDMAERIEPVLEYIQANLDKKLLLVSLAAISNMSVSNFCRVFKQVLGQTPIQYINNRRIIKAAELLSETSRSVLEISEECGFFSISNFITTFKKHTRKSPLDFRKNNMPGHR